MPVVHYTEVTKTLHVTVKYVCEHCGMYNIDEDQKLVVKGVSEGSLIGSMSKKQIDSATEKANSESVELLNNIKNKHYDRLSLDCTCNYCHKQQSWASFIKKKPWSIVMFVFGVFFFLAGIVNPEFRFGLLIGPLLILPLAYILINNSINQRKVSKLNEQQLPEFEIR